MAERQHLAVVQDDSRRVEGVVTLEDVLEYLLSKPIVDRHDAQKFALRRTKCKFSRTILAQLELTINWFDISSLNTDPRGYSL